MFVPLFNGNKCLQKDINDSAGDGKSNSFYNGLLLLLRLLDACAGQTNKPSNKVSWAFSIIYSVFGQISIWTIYPEVPGRNSTNMKYFLLLQMCWVGGFSTMIISGFIWHLITFGAQNASEISVACISLAVRVWN